jgi:hypothetical protein
VIDLIGWILVLLAPVLVVLRWLKPKATRAVIETDARLETRRVAELSARIEKNIIRLRSTAGGRDRFTNTYRLVVENNGAAGARDIEILVDGQLLVNHPAVAKGQTVRTQIAPHSSLKFLLAIASDPAKPLDLTIIWTDDSGQVDRIETLVRVS